MDEEFITLPESRSPSPPPPSSPLPKPPKNLANGTPPWLSPDTLRQNITHPLNLLHSEIHLYTALASPTPQELVVRDKLVDEVQGLVKACFKGEMKAVVFGSMSTGLLRPDSDIDMAVVPLDTDSVEEISSAMTVSSMNAFADMARKAFGGNLSYLEVVSSARVPIVKLTHDGYGISVDVSFNNGNGGMKGAVVMQRYLKQFPVLRPLTMVLKQFMAARKLHEPYSGGMGSYCLQLLIVSFLQQRFKADVAAARSMNSNLGAMLLDFFELYGENFNYLTVGISTEGTGAYFPKGHPNFKKDFYNQQRPLTVAIENPVERGADVGKATFRIDKIRRAFQTAFAILRARVTRPYSGNGSILKEVIPIEEWMVERVLTMGEGLNPEFLQRFSGEIDFMKDDTSMPPLTSRDEGEMSFSEGEEGEDSGDDLGKNEVSVINCDSSSDADPLRPKQNTFPFKHPPPRIRLDALPPPVFHVFRMSKDTATLAMKAELLGRKEKGTVVNPGDLCLMCTHDKIYGPFVAQCCSAWRIDPDIFKGDKFPYQVRVRNAGTSKQFLDKSGFDLLMKGTEWDDCKQPMVGQGKYHVLDGEVGSRLAEYVVRVHGWDVNKIQSEWMKSDSEKEARKATGKMKEKTHKQKGRKRGPHGDGIHTQNQKPRGRGQYEAGTKKRRKHSPNQKSK